ncbi:hypothetical protein [Azospirillum brasilense]|uniref:hypothetical protein n=1 Tax=Azospirillum brasilense TaxID=192 RepID=UPI001B3B8E3C|nr:hypothetical protein [Azospirillum brasilense]
MPSHAQSVPTQSRNARAVRRVGKKATPSLRTIERSRAPSLALAEALGAVSAFAAAPAYRRRAIERTVEALLTILDHMDGDPDLEPQDEGADEFEDLRELWASTRAEGPGDPDDAEDSGDLEWSTVPATGGVLGLPFDLKAEDAELFDRARIRRRLRTEVL